MRTPAALRLIIATVAVAGLVPETAVAGGSHLPGDPVEDCATLAADSLLPPLHTLDAARLDRLLADLRARLPRYEDRLRALALARHGTPYALGTLGEASPEDPDPVFQLEDADCTVLVLTTVALAHARSLAEAEAWMGPANYRRQGDAYPVTYRNRLHFTADRLHASPLFADVTGRVARAGERRSVRVTLNRRDDGEELLPIMWQREIEIDFIPSSHLASVLPRVPAVAGIAFVREANIENGFLVAHEGFLLDRRCLLHASSGAGDVQIIDVLDYLFRGDPPDTTRSPRFDGAIIYAMPEGGPAPPGGEAAWRGGDGPAGNGEREAADGEGREEP